MANNSRSEATDPSVPVLPVVPLVPAQPSYPAQAYQQPVYAQPTYLPQQQAPNTTTTISTGSGGFDGFLPSILPAIQSGSYVLVIIGGFVIWRSRNLLQSFLEKHIALVEMVRESLDKQIDTNDNQMRILRDLTLNNTRLIDVIESSQCIAPNAKSRARATEEVTQ